jgi:PAS domain S-box-containing protein
MGGTLETERAAKRERLRRYRAERLGPRVQFSAGLVLAGAVAFFFADIVFLGDRTLPAHAFQVMAAVFSLAVIVALRTDFGRRHAVTISTAYIALVVVLVAVIGAIRGEARADVVLHVVILLGVAVLLPWGIGPQLIVAAFVAVGTVFNAWVVDGSVLDPFDIQVLVAVAFGIAVSLAIAYELRRTASAEIARHEALLRSEAETRAHEEQLRMVMSSVPAILWTVDRQRRFRHLTGTALASIGVDPEDAIGRRLDDYLSDDENASAIVAAVEDAFAGDSSRQEIVYRDEYYRLDLEPLRDVSGQIVGAIGTSLNINDLKVAERELTELNAALEQRVTERTAEIESFTYAVSHDLRQPLRAVSGFASVIEESLGDRLDPGTREYLDRLRQGMTKMWRMIDDLLQLARVGGSKLRAVQTDVSALAADILEGLRDGDHGRGVEVSVEPGLIAFGDEGLVRLLLQNLLENAWKFTQRKEHAHIAFGSEGAKDGFVTFFVADDGAGFDMDHADKLFAPFQRLHHPDEFSGTGIGLATVARIVARHGGRVWAESGEDTGTIFRFTLPRADAFSKD